MIVFGGFGGSLIIGACPIEHPATSVEYTNDYVSRPMRMLLIVACEVTLWYPPIPSPPIISIAAFEFGHQNETTFPSKCDIAKDGETNADGSHRVIRQRKTNHMELWLRSAAPIQPNRVLLRRLCCPEF